MVTDFLSCPQCGNPLTDGKLCNLTCRRAFTSPSGHAFKEVFAEAQIVAQVERFMLALDATRFNGEVAQNPAC
jgi:hypothetical protein